MAEATARTAPALAVEATWPVGYVTSTAVGPVFDADVYELEERLPLVVAELDLRVEVWDGPPPEDDDAGWADADLVADLPYWSPGGTVVLNYLVAMDGGPEFALLGSGPYCVRTWCRPLAGEPTEGWRLQFWPLGDAVPEPARWRRRAWTRPTGTEPGWSRYFGEDVGVLTSAVCVVAGSAPGAGVAELEAHFQGWGRPGYLDGPAGIEAQRDRVDGFARELGVPAPRTRGCCSTSWSRPGSCCVPTTTPCRGMRPCRTRRGRIRS